MMITCFNCFISDKTTICGKDKFDRNENLLDHPYNCAMYIACNMDHTYNTEGFVWSYEDGRHVFYRAGNRSAWDYEDVVKSCKQERTLRFVHIYFRDVCVCAYACAHVCIITIKNMSQFVQTFLRNGCFYRYS